MKTTDKEPGEALAYYADRLCRFADVAKQSGISTLVIASAYDPLTGDNSVSVRMIGNYFELMGALETQDLSGTVIIGEEDDD